MAAIKPSDGRGSFGELARFTRTLAESSKMPIEVHLVSDLQKTAMPPGFTDLRLAGDTTLILHPVGGEIPNWTVENVKAPDACLRSQARAHPGHHRRLRDARGQAHRVADAERKQVQIEDRGRAGGQRPRQVEFLGLAASYGFNHCEVRIDSADALPGDDSFPFSVERTDPKKILFIDNGRHANAPLYFRTALDSSTDAAFALDVQRPETAATANLVGLRAGGAGRSGSAAAGARRESAALRQLRGNRCWWSWVRRRSRCPRFRWKAIRF